MNKYNIKNDMNIINSNSRYTLMIIKIALCIFVVLNLLSRKISYDLILIFLITLLVENIQLYRTLKQREDLIAVVAITIAIIGLQFTKIINVLKSKSKFKLKTCVP